MRRYEIEYTDEMGAMTEADLLRSIIDEPEILEIFLHTPTTMESDFNLLVYELEEEDFQYLLKHFPEFLI